MSHAEASIPIDLAPPLRPFRNDDAAVAARLNEMASDGLALRVWRDMAAEGEDPWAVGRRRQIERVANGQTVVMLDPGHGAVACLIGNPIGHEPEDPGGVAALFRPLVELENHAPGSWYINILAVLPDARRQGYARVLLRAAEEITQALGLRETSLIVSESNRNAVQLYTSTGYRERARRPMVNDDATEASGEWLLLIKERA
ncbi:GNAT family N-acetyltransferase [Tropicimonas marinistellae]|uniref:GNAT family N-acetyltransferase n=1 Tax=Tropicimonas marinistellae TaxID=1739787 RepID=UPI00082A333F|nr:GNAT family N-acetyltransferase [Tropicimonas marinistellae]